MKNNCFLVALDIGNVTMQLSFDQMKKNLELDTEEKYEEFKKFWYEHEHGGISTEPFLTCLGNLTGHRYSKLSLYRLFAEGVQIPTVGMKEAVKKLSEQLKIRFVYLSDIGEIHLENTLRYSGFSHLVFGGIYSFEVGFFKMEGNAMFNAFEQKYGKPDIYFDDRADIIEHAIRDSHWNAIQFQSANQFYSVVKKQFSSDS